MKTVTAGGTLTFIVSAVDANNVLQLNYRGTLIFSSSDSQATLPSNSTLTVGVGTFLATLRTAGNPTLTARDSGSASVTVTSTTSDILVTPRVTNRLLIQIFSTPISGSALIATVSALDSFNNIATSYAGTVHVTCSDTAATTPANSSLTAGIGTFVVTFKQSGSRTVTATDTVTASFTATATVSVAPKAFFGLGATGQTASVGFLLTVTARDARNSTDSTYIGTIIFTSDDPNAVLPGPSLFSAPTSTYGPVKLYALGTPRITFTDANLGITGSKGFTVAANTGGVVTGPDYLVTVPATVTAGVQFNFTVTALDGLPDQSLWPAYDGTIEFSTNNPGSTVPNPSTLTNGVGVFSAILTTIGGPPGTPWGISVDDVDQQRTATSQNMTVQ